MNTQTPTPAGNGMHYRAVRVASLLAASVLALSLVGCSHGVSVNTNNPDTARIDSTLDGFVPNTVTGYSFEMVSKNQILDQRVQGSINNINQPYLLASASKSPAMAAILTLVDQGKLNLSTRVGTYLQNDGITWPIGKSTITLKMLMDHTSGLPGLTSKNQPACIDVTNAKAATTGSMQACVQDIANSTLDALPGTKFIYGGADYQVAGFIAARAAGYTGADAWQRFFTAALAKPLGATTLMYIDSQSNPRVSGGALSNAPDYGKFLQMLLNDGSYNGTRVLSPQSVTELMTNQLTAGMSATPPAGATASHFNGYSFGFFQDAPSIYTPSPGPEFSDQGLFGTTPWIDYGLHYAAIILLPATNALANPQALQAGTAMWDAVHPETIALAQKLKLQ